MGNFWYFSLFIFTNNLLFILYINHMSFMKKMSEKVSALILKNVLYNKKLLQRNAQAIMSY